MKRVWFLLPAFALLLALYLAGQKEERVARGVQPLAEGAEGSLVERATGASGGGSEEATRLRGAEQGSVSRRPARKGVVEGWVITNDNAPIESASVTLVALTDRDQSWEPAWRRDGWGVTDSPRTTQKTRADGKFVFEEWPAREESGRFLLFASAIGYEGAVAESTFPAPTGQPIRLVLSASDPLRVSVRMPDGSVAANALVERFGLSHEDRTKAEEDLEDFAWRQLSESFVTNESGSVTLPRLPGEQVLVATRDGLASVPWRGMPRKEVRLELLDTFTLGGIVSLPDWSALNYEGERRIRVTVKMGGLEESLAVLRGVEDGEWGPLQVPRVERGDYNVYLEGSPIIPIHHRFSPPEPGAYQRVDFSAELGHQVWVLPVTEGGETVLAGEATLKWWENGVEKSVSRRAREDGYINVWSIPDTQFDIFVTAPGYANSVLLSQELGEPGDYYPVTMREGRTVDGVCLKNGQPVPSFRVDAWSATNAFNVASVTVWNDPEGRFHLEGLDGDDVQLVASDSVSPPSSPVAVHSEDGNQAFVILNLPEDASRQIIVTDAVTGSPIEGASIRHLTPGVTNVESWWGPVFETNGRGLAEVNGLEEGVSVFVVAAAGYAREVLRLDRPASGEGRPASVSLSRPQALTLRLKGPDGFDYTRINAESSVRLRRLPLRYFSQDGVLRYDDVSPGAYPVELYGAFGAENKASITLELDLIPGQDWTYEVPVGPGNHLKLSFRPKEQVADLSKYYVLIYYKTALGANAHEAAYLTREGTYETRSVPSRSVEILVFDPTGAIVAGTSGTFVGGDLSVELKEGQEPFLLRVVDEDREPVGGVTVITRGLGSGASGPLRSTDTQGEVRLYALPAGKVRVDLQHPSKGLALDQWVDTGSGEATVVFAPQGRLDLFVAHGGSGVPGVVGDFVGEQGQLRRVNRTSDSNGILSWERISIGTYQVRLEHARFWPQDIEVTASKGRALQSVALRERSALTVRLRTQDGVPVSGLRVALVDLETGTGVSEWIDAGLVEGSDVTDSQGQVSFKGLPEGVYLVRTVGVDPIQLGKVRCEGPGGDSETLLLPPEAR